MSSQTFPPDPGLGPQPDVMPVFAPPEVPSQWAPPTAAPQAASSPAAAQPVQPVPSQWAQPAPASAPRQWAVPVSSGPVNPWASVPRNNAQNSLGMWALICGLVPIVALIIMFSADAINASARSVALVVLCWLAAGIVAIILGALSIRAASKGQATNKGMGVAGLVLGILSTVLFGLFVILAIFLSLTY